jgi:hypothetical protein
MKALRGSHLKRQAHPPLEREGRREAAGWGEAQRPVVPALVAEPRLPAKREVARPVLQLRAAAATLAASVLADSAMEHYRGSFHNKIMYVPLISSALDIAASVQGASTHAGRTGRSLAYWAGIAVGAAGAGFHFYNVGKRVGGFRWENFFYGAPVGAPFALILSGLTGLAADRIAGARESGERPVFMGLPAGRALAALSSIGLFGATAEAALLHFRGSFQNPAMFFPVTLPPIAAALTLEAAVNPTPRKRPLARFWLGLTSALGVLGVGFHSYGVSRGMGGWRNWRQNALDGPPLPAPPSFSGLALAGLAALNLIEGERK